MLSSRFCIFEILIYLCISTHSYHRKEQNIEDKYKAQKKYAKNNIKKLSCSYPAEFVNQFKDAWKKLNIKQAEVIRKTMQQVIDEAEKEDL
jgi:hypothetical protein